MAINSLYPTIRPSLLLDFANTKVLDPRITYSRASTGTYYDDNTVAKAEENLLLRSQDFDNSYWFKQASTVTSNTTVAPDVTTTADTITANAGASTHYVGSGAVSLIATVHVASCFVKAGTHAYVQIWAGNQSVHANFDVTAGSGATGTSSGVTSSSITDVGNGWYRCVVVFTVSTANGVNIGLVSSASATRNESWTAAGTETIILWGAQLEQRSSVTAYTPTTTQPITTYIPVLQTAAAGVARFDHNPVTRESLGLLVEEQRTNLLTYSEDFANAAWGKANVTVSSNTTIAPDGTLTADKLQEDTLTTVHRVEKGVTVTPSTSYTFSFYAKAVERTVVCVRTDVTGSNANTAFNLANGTVQFSGAGQTGSIVNIGNGWYRCTSTAVSGSAVTTVNYRISLSDTAISSDAANQYTGVSGYGAYIWGAQLEAGAFPTSYIKTEASQVTRSADSASMTGSNFTSWFNNAEGTVYAEFERFGTSAAFPAIVANDGTDGNAIRLFIWGAGNSPGSQVVVNNATQQESVGTAVGAGVFAKLALSYKANDFAFSVNGNTASLDTSGTVPVVSQLLFGQRVSPATYLNGYIRKFAYYPKASTATHVQALTSV